MLRPDTWLGLGLGSGSGLPDTDIEERLKSEIKFDPDVWIVEVENPGGENPFEELT